MLDLVVPSFSIQGQEKIHANNKNTMSSPQDDPELMSVFSLEEDDEESDEEYFPTSLSGTILKEVEMPYDKAVRIQQANRELFSQPIVKKKLPTKVKFDLVPKLIVMDGNIEEGNEIDNSDSNGSPKKGNSNKRRQTPLVVPRRATPPNHTSFTAQPAMPQIKNKSPKNRKNPSQ